MYCYLWRYRVRAEKLAEFRAAYGPDGDWARLFRRDPGYVRTILLQDADDPARFMTLDFWTSKLACQAFRQTYSEEFEAIDRRCETFTLSETQVGDFHQVEPAHEPASG